MVSCRCLIAFPRFTNSFLVAVDSAQEAAQDAGLDAGLNESDAKKITVSSNDISKLPLSSFRFRADNCLQPTLPRVMAWMSLSQRTRCHLSLR